MGAHLGATVIATVSRTTRRVSSSVSAPHHVIVYCRDSFAEAVMRLTGGRGADVVYDAVGNDTFAGSLAALAVRGHLVSFGQASGPGRRLGYRPLRLQVGDRLAAELRPLHRHAEKLAPSMSTASFRRFGRGSCRIDPPTRYRLDNAAEAHRDLESRRTTGALVLTV